MKSLAKCVELCVTCSHACAAASVVMSGESQYSKKVCDLCAEIFEMVLPNVKKMAGILNIAGYVRNPVVDVHKNVEI